MSIKITETELPGVLIIEPAVFKDPRGYFMETYHKSKFSEIGLDRAFVQDNHSHSVRGTLRGLHYQLEKPQAKLVYVIRGEIFDVAVDIRKGSPTFGKWVGVTLSDRNHKQIFIPEGFAHGLCVLSDSADVIYKCTDLYAPGDEYGILWSDPGIGIEWPVENPLLSDKDKVCPELNNAPLSNLPDY